MVVIIALTLRAVEKSRVSDTIRSLQYGGVAASVTAMRPLGVVVALVTAVLVVNRSRNHSQTLCYSEAKTDL